MNIIKKEVQRLLEEDRLYEELMREQAITRNIENQKLIDNSKSWIDKTHAASMNDYMQWLYQYTLKGGKCTVYYDYDFCDMRIAMADIEITPLYGASRLNIIIPKGLKYSGDKGHNNIYAFDDDYNEADHLHVPIYKNMTN